MRVSSQINKHTYIHNHNNKQQSFKSNITFDIGGSQREGSCKIYYATTPKDEPIYRMHTTVNTFGKYQFKDADEFIDKIIEKIVKIQNINKDKIEQKGYDKSENALKNVAIFLPSYTSQNRAFYLANHRNIENKPLKDVDFKNFKERLIEKGVEIDKDFKFKLLQDAMGTGLAMTQRLHELGKLTPGKYYTTCMTGGGCAVSNIEVVDKDSVIIKSSGSSYLSESLNLQKVSKAGASAPAVIENFCKAMGFNAETIEDIKACHLAEFTMTDKTVFRKNEKTNKLKELLLDTQKFEVSFETDNNFQLKIKDEYKSQYNLARRNAIDKYCLALARLAIIKKNEGSNGMIVTGSLAKAINSAASEYYNMGIAQWITLHLNQSFNTYELEKMQETYHFEVMCDDRFNIDNNTECRDSVHLAEFVAPTRGNWLKLDLNKINNKDKVDLNSVELVKEYSLKQP